MKNNICQYYSYSEEVDFSLDTIIWGLSKVKNKYKIQRSGECLNLRRITKAVNGFKPNISILISKDNTLVVEYQVGIGNRIFFFVMTMFFAFIFVCCIFSLVPFFLLGIHLAFFYLSYEFLLRFFFKSECELFERDICSQNNIKLISCKESFVF